MGAGKDIEPANLTASMRGNVVLHKVRMPYDCRVVKALGAAINCLQTDLLLRDSAQAASSQQLSELLQKDWPYIGACLGSSDSNGVAALIAHLQAALQKALSAR